MLYHRRVETREKTDNLVKIKIITNIKVKVVGAYQIVIPLATRQERIRQIFVIYARNNIVWKKRRDVSEGLLSREKCAK